MQIVNAQQAPKPVRFAVQAGGLSGYAEISPAQAQYVKGLMGMLGASIVMVAAWNLPSKRPLLKLLAGGVGLASFTASAFTMYQSAHALRLRNADEIDIARADIWGDDR